MSKKNTYRTVYTASRYTYKKKYKIGKKYKNTTTNNNIIIINKSMPIQEDFANV